MATTFSPELVDDLYAQGYAFYENGKYTEAVHTFRTLTTLDPQNKDMWMGLGASLQMSQEYEKAIPVYLAAAVITAQTPDPAPFLHVAECHFSLDQIEKGLHILELAEKITLEDNQNTVIKDRILLLKQIWSGEKQC